MSNLINITIEGAPINQTIYAVTQDINNVTIFSGEVTVEEGGLVSIILDNSLLEGDTVFVYLDNGEMTTNTFKAAVGSTVVITEGQWVAKLDGATKSWQLSGPIVIPANTDCAIRFKINGLLDEYEGIFRSEDSLDWIRFTPQSQTNNIQAKLSGSFLIGIPYSELMVRDGQEKSFVLRRESGRFYIDIDGQPFTLSNISGQFSIDTLCEFGGDCFEGYISDFEVEIDGIVTNAIPLTNKEQGATQLATIGDINAIMLNYTGDEWEAKV